MPGCARCRTESKELQARGQWAVCARCAAELDAGAAFDMRPKVDELDELKDFARADLERRARELATRVDSHPIGRLALDFLEGRSARRRRERGR